MVYIHFHEAEDKALYTATSTAMQAELGTELNCAQFLVRLMSEYMKNHKAAAAEPTIELAA